MSANKKEHKHNSSDDEHTISKTSNTKDNEKEEISIKNEEIENCEGCVSDDKYKTGESSIEIVNNNEEISKTDSVVTTFEDSKPPVSVCFKQTNEVFSKENHDLMIRDIHNFFSNLKELQSNRALTETSKKRKLESAVEDSGEKSDLSQSEECAQPSKKLILDASATEGISPQQSQTLYRNSELYRPAAVDSISSVRVGSLLSDVATETSDHQNPSGSDPHSSPQAGTSSEDPSTVDQPNAPENPRIEDNHPISQSAPTNPPPEPMVIEHYEQPSAELNGVRSHSFPGTTDVQNIVPIFQCFLNDLLELRSFLDGRQVSSVVPAEAETSSEVAYLDRQVASITDEFGTGVESKVALITRGAVSEWNEKPFSGVDVESLSDHSEQSEDSSLSGTSFHRVESESNSNETPELSESPDPIPSCSESDPTQITTKHSQMNPEVGLTSTSETKDEPPTSENQVKCIESELISEKFPERTTNPPDPILTDCPKFPAELDHLNLPSEVSPLLLALNTEGRKLLNSCIETSKNFLRTCLMNGVHAFHGTLLEHIKKTLDTMCRVISIREDCSVLLKKCPDKNSIAGITYILKVKYCIAKVYNQLLEDILAMNTNFREVVKDKLTVDSVD